MPGKTNYSSRKGWFEVSVEDELNNKCLCEYLPTDHFCKSVYFTDEKPYFRITIKNNTWFELQGQLRLGIFHHLDKDNRLSFHSIELDLDPLSEEEHRIQSDLLAEQGTFLLGFSKAPRERIRDDRAEITSRGSTRLRNPLYTFMCYDRDYYKVNYLWPRRAQYIAALLAILIVSLGVLQLLSSANIIFVG